jgi:uncharacterized damage-inducible protein DinB
MFAGGGLEVMTHEQSLVLRNDAVDAFRHERAATMRVIEAVPADKSGYRPDPVVKSAFDLAWHLVSAEHRFITAVITGAFDFTTIERPASVQTPADIARWHEETSERDVARLASLSAEQLVTPVDFRGLFTLPAVRFLRLAAHHSVHHRGQLSMYLRPMGAKVPAIYGESYDTAQAKAAAAQGASA